MSWTDLLWRWPDALFHIIPGLLIYQLLGTIRHELAHVVAYWLAGWKITGLHVLPHWYKDEWYFGRMTAELQGGAKHNLHMHLAPYEVNAIAVIIWAVVSRFVEQPWSSNPHVAWNLWAAFTILFLVSPAVDTLYNLYKFVRHNSGDFRAALTYWEMH